MSETNTTETPSTETAKPEVPFVDGKRVQTKEQTLKPRGKSGEKEHPGVKVNVTFTEVNDLSVAVAAILETVGNDTAAALAVVNSAIERAATQAVYDATFGDEIKIRAMIKTFLAAGMTADVADKTARELFKTKGLPQ